MTAGREKTAVGVALRVLGFAIWLGFILFCIGLSDNHGLSYADDAWYAIIAKSLANGIGYATTFPESGELPHLTPFNPLTGMGPTLIVPCALAFRLFGKSEVLPGLIAILTWGSLFTFVLARTCRRVDAASFLLGVSVMCAAFVATFSFHFEQWYAFLGEIPAVALVIAAYWILSNERSSRGWLLLAGLLFGLALQTKLLAAVAVTGLVWIFVFKGLRAGWGRSRWLRYAAALLTGLLMPTLVFETYKLLQLGLDAYAINWGGMVTAIKEMGMGDTHLTWFSLQQRLESIYDRFGLSLLGLLALNAVGLFLTGRSTSKDWTLFSSGLLLSTTFLAIYWATLSKGWPRYLVICIAMSAFLLSIPIFALGWWRKLSFTLLVLILLKTGFSRAGNILDSADHGLFRSNSDRTARASLVQLIEQRKKEGAIILASRWWGSFADVEFLLSESMNFERLEAVSEFPGRKLILFNHHFDPTGDEAINTMRARISSIVFTDGPYELVEVR